MTTFRTVTASDIQNLFNRTAVGASGLLEDYFYANRSESNYPPYNIEQLATDDFRITLAVAGFTRDEIEVSINNGHLIITGGYNEVPEVEETKVDESKFPVFLHKGIAKRSFNRTFKMVDYVVVTDVALKDGLLVINLKRELPDSLKPRVIEIN